MCATIYFKWCFMPRMINCWDKQHIAGGFVFPGLTLIFWIFILVIPIGLMMCMVIPFFYVLLVTFRFPVTLSIHYYVAISFQFFCHLCSHYKNILVYMGLQNVMAVTLIFIVSQIIYIIEILWFSIDVNSHCVTEFDSGCRAICVMWYAYL